MNIQKYLDLFEYQVQQPEDPNEVRETTGGFWSFKLDAIKAESPEYLKMSELIRDSDLDHDSAYTFTVEALQAMKEIRDSHSEEIKYGMTDPEDPELIDNYSEAPIYNSQLMEWLSKGSNWSFLEEVLNELGWSNGDQLMQKTMIAYSQAWEAHYFKVLEAIKE